MTPHCLPAQGGDANPAGAVGVVLALAVPVKLHLHPAVLVREDLLARRADDDGRLRPGHRWLARHARRAERQSQRNAGEAVTVRERCRRSIGSHPRAAAVLHTM